MADGHRVILIGASTGGPPALVQVLAALPAGLPAAVLVAQHMPPGFTPAFARRLARICPLPVREAEEGDRAEPGLVLVAPGGRQTSLERRGGRLIVRVSDEPQGLTHRPSVDHLFRSAVDAVGHAAIAVVLTGMGSDGAVGVAALRAAGALVITESRETARVFGMPRAAAGAADHTLRLEAIGPALASLVAPPAPPAR